MKHLLMNPDFPDIVGAWAAEEAKKESRSHCCANANAGHDADEVSDPLLPLVARLEVAATRLW